MALATLLALGGQAFGVLCTIDAVPAATLLVPNFLVDVSDDACANNTGVTTLFSVNNASAAPTIAHVTLWTDQSVPVLDFDVYLTGYDVQTINLKDIFCDGTLPQTGYFSGGNTISNNGLFSEPKVPFDGCNNGTTPGEGPYYSNPFSSELVTLLKEWFTGQQSSSLGTCAGSGQVPFAIGYITIDQTEECSLLFPADPDYYTTGVLGYDNILWGDYFIVDPDNNFSQGFTAVHVEAGPQGYFDTGEHTFYGRYEPGLAANNRREPLGTTYAARYALGAPFDGTIHWVWREADGSSASYSCGAAGPSWYPLTQATDNSVIVFDEQENPFVPQVDPGPSNPLPPDEIAVRIPNEVNWINVGVLDGEAELDVGDFNFGWVYYNLQAPQSAYGDDITQNWVSWVMQASARYSVGVHGIQLDTACTAGSVPLPVAGPITANPSEE